MIGISRPTQTPDASWLGRVHRGTPWQTLYLKAPGATLPSWMQWTGNGQLLTNWNGSYGLTYDAFFTQPTNDWRLASLLVSLLNTNDPRTLRLRQPIQRSGLVRTSGRHDRLDQYRLPANLPRSSCRQTPLKQQRLPQLSTL